MKGSSIQTGTTEVRVRTRRGQKASLWKADSTNTAADRVAVKWTTAGDGQPAGDAETSVQCISPQRLADDQVRASLNTAAMTAPVLLMIVASPAARTGLNGNSRVRATGAPSGSSQRTAQALRHHGAMVASMAAHSPALTLSLESVSPAPRKARELPAEAQQAPAPAASRQFERLCAQDRIFDGRDQQIELDSGSGRFGVSFAVGGSAQFWVEPQGSEPLASEHFQGESGARRVFYYDANELAPGLSNFEFVVLRKDRGDETVRLSALVM
jgi:hypothetical protein